MAQAPHCKDEHGVSIVRRLIHDDMNYHRRKRKTPRPSASLTIMSLGNLPWPGATPKGWK